MADFEYMPRNFIVRTHDDIDAIELLQDALREPGFLIDRQSVPELVKLLKRAVKHLEKIEQAEMKRE